MLIIKNDFKHCHAVVQTGSTHNIMTTSNSFRSVFRRAVFVLFSLVVLVMLSACSSGNSSKGPKVMPDPETDVLPIPTAAPTITADPVIHSDDSSANINSDGEGTASDSDNETNSSIATDTGTDSSEDTDMLTDTLIPTRDPDAPWVVVLDPGHGGAFTGASYFGHTEKNLTLQMANYVRDYLLKNYDKIEVYLTRESDIALDPDLKIELEQRAVIAKEHNGDFFVSLHFNASESHNLNGTTVYASFRDNVCEASQGIAASILDQLVGLGLKNNGVKTRMSQDYYAEDGSRLDYYAVIRHNALRDVPGVIVEHCFMDNETDYAFMDSDEKLMILAEADAKGIANYLGLKAK